MVCDGNALVKQCLKARCRWALETPVVALKTAWFSNHQNCTNIPMGTYCCLCIVLTLWLILLKYYFLIGFVDFFWYHLNIIMVILVVIVGRQLELTPTGTLVRLENLSFLGLKTRVLPHHSFKIARWVFLSVFRLILQNS